MSPTNDLSKSAAADLAAAATAFLARYGVA
jgi:hypothetical protein